ncbi:hypothetical protein ULMS_29220 [Patiriisocius marinistellae]|uniref:Uncharacterized protein n=1 Tax=Patiriisocius marinistellae TaxID=2494560 RepID=A0A5J4G1C3_9FLAO|nr:hypothetical protein [Patiriisocius marinistellae]GEQ87414.1 hypothetical protein ULMS_29220 [Patiriisocius marinistellae]
MELGQKCKINFDDREYKVIDNRIKKTDKSTTEKEHIIIEHFVDLEEINNPENRKMNVSTTKVYPI